MILIKHIAIAVGPFGDIVAGPKLTEAGAIELALLAYAAATDYAIDEEPEYVISLKLSSPGEIAVVAAASHSLEMLTEDGYAYTPEEWKETNL